MRTVRDRIFVVVLPALTLVAAAVLAVSCVPSDEPADDTQTAESDGWLTGDTHQKFDTIANQLGGFDQTMIEVGYRYIELYWAGEDENWEFAKYQIEEMRGAMLAGFERRPEREASGQAFMNNALPAIEEAAALGDAEMFRERFRNLTTNCNVCHMMEDMRFIVVDQPTVRANAWRGPTH